MSEQSTWGDTGRPLPKLENVVQDESWTKLLPADSVIVSAKGAAASYWSQTARIDIRVDGNEEKSYFLKLSFDDIGKGMVKGEFESMYLLYIVSPSLVPCPIECGTYSNDPNTHFFLCEYMDFRDNILPPKTSLCRVVAELHRKSIEYLPQRKFGFHVTTYNGTVRQNTSWASSWETFFTRLLRETFELEEEVRGRSLEISSMLPAIYEKVCPRLLLPLESEGRMLRPCLIHGDLWSGNIAMRTDIDQIRIFDAAAFWGHNEYDLHMWRGERYKIRGSYREEYFRHYPPSPPEEDCEDRNLLYSLMADLHDSILFKGSTTYRELLVASMRELVERYPGGYEGSA